MKTIYILITTVTLLLVGCSGYEPDVSVSDTNQSFSVTELLRLRGYTYYLDAVALTGIEAELFAPETTTIFAPNNAAFQAFLDKRGMEALSEMDMVELADILRYHAVGSFYTSGTSDAVLSTLLTGSNLYLGTSVDGNLGINGRSAIQETNLLGTDGVAHGINKVEAAPAASIYAIIANSPNHTTLKGLIDRAGLNATFSEAGAYTLFAPNNAAFVAVGLSEDSLAALSDDVVKNELNFHAIAGRRYQAQIPNGRISSLIALSRTQQLLNFDLADQEINGVAFDSTDFNSENGVVHFISGYITADDELSDELKTTDWAALIATLEDSSIYNDLSETVSVLVGRGDTIKVTDFNDDEAISDWLSTYTFDGSINFSSLANGTKVTSRNESSFYIQRGAAAIRAVNESRIDAAPSSSAYDGYYNESPDKYPTPLPEENITKVLETSGFPLLATAIRVAERENQVDAANTTFYAITDSLFTAKFGYMVVDSIMALEEGTQADVEAVEKLQQFIDNQTISGEVTGVYHITNVFPAQESVSGGDVSWIKIENKPVVVLNPKDPINKNIGFRPKTTSIFAANGVIVVMADVFPDPN